MEKILKILIHRKVYDNQIVEKDFIRQQIDVKIQCFHVNDLKSEFYHQLHFYETKLEINTCNLFVYYSMALYLSI